MPYQEAPYPPMTDALYPACADAVHVVTADGAVLRAGRAVAFILGQLGFRRLAWLMGVWPISWLVERAYGAVARNRAFFGRFFFRRE